MFSTPKPNGSSASFRLARRGLEWLNRRGDPPCQRALRSATVLCCLAPSLAWILCTMAAGEELAKLSSAQGIVQMRAAPVAPWAAAGVGTGFQAGNGVRTAANSRCGVLFFDGVMVRLSENALLEFKPPVLGRRAGSLRLSSGSAYLFVRDPKQVPHLETPLVSAAVRGTDLVVAVGSGETIISVLQGEAECRNELGVLLVRGGEQALTRPGQAPVKRILLHPIDAVQWALYYPAVVGLEDYADFLPGATPAQRAGWEALASGQFATAEGLFTGPDWRDALGRSLVAAGRGRLTQALQAVAAMPAPRSPGLDLDQAGLYLSAGEVAKAEAALARAQAGLKAAAPEVRPRLLAACLAQQSIIALTHNDRDRAQALAGEAEHTSSTSAAAARAMSYAEQAHFRLGAARHWAQEAVRLAPASGPTLARLAELQLGYGEFNPARRTILQALKVAPADPRVLTVLGFVYLTGYDFARGIEAFRRAIALDDTAGLPHLGLGLALIRKNRLPEGRREIETAVHLEPADASFRSYLGKAYFEEDRYHLAPREYQLAEQLDAFDPTPHFYEAFYKLADHRPVEALWDIEHAIKLNHNRAVYRSRLMLDEDQAARNADLSEAFRLVGFNERARVAATQSLNQDYANAAAHLLLQESGFTTPRFDQAAISELLIWRLLTPLNVNATRDQASFNEYTSLFDRERPQLFLDGQARSADQFFSGSVRQTEVQGRFAYRVRLDQDYLHGYRNNDWEKTRDVSVLSLVQLTPADTLSLEPILGWRHEGDPFIGTNPWQADGARQSDFDQLELRAGYHHRFGPGAHFIGQALYVDRKLTWLDLIERGIDVSLLQPGLPPFTFPDVALANETLSQRYRGVRGDGQLLWDWPLVSLVAGGGAFADTARKLETGTVTADALGAFAGLPLDSVGLHPERSERSYVYSTWHVAPWLDATLGSSYTRLALASANAPPPFTSETRTLDQFSPKTGLSFYLTPDTMLRAAYFRTLGSASIIDLDWIEPTQVAGFTQWLDDAQLFDGVPGSRAETFGLGLDRKFSQWTYAGAEATYRKAHAEIGSAGLTLADNLATGRATELISGASQTIEQAHEELARVYLYQILTRRLTSTLDYTLARDTVDSSVTSIQTHRARLGLNYFHPSGSLQVIEKVF